MRRSTKIVAMDIHTDSIVVAVAEPGRKVPRLFGTIASTSEAVAKLAEQLGGPSTRLRFCYEAGPCGYGVYRQLTALGHECTVVAPSLIPRRSGDRIKTDRRDALNLVNLDRSGQLTAVWVPDSSHEAMRDLVRARAAAVRSLRRARQQLSGFLLRHGRVHGGKAWTRAHRRWLATLTFEHAAQQIVLQDYIDAVERAEMRRDQLQQQITELVPEWSLAPLVEALQALRGVALITAVTLAAELGDLSRFEHPRQLTAYVGLVPSEHSSGQSRRQGGLTKAGNGEARRVLVEAAWSYRLRARITRARLQRIEGLPKEIRDIAWKAERRLCARMRRLRAAGKALNLVTAAIAREILTFAWAIARLVRPQAVA